MTRSILTAAYLGEACGLTPEARLDVFERKGLYDVDANGNEVGRPGPGRDYFETRFPTVALPDGLGDAGWWDRPVESDEDFVVRVAGALDSLRARHAASEDRVAVVAHGDFIDQCVNEIMGVGRRPDYYARLWSGNWVFHNTSVSRIDFHPESENVVYLNRIEHLDFDLVTW